MPSDCLFGGGQQLRCAVESADRVNKFRSVCARNNDQRPASTVVRNSSRRIFRTASRRPSVINMYCLQCLIPVLLIPKPTNPALMQTHVMFIVLYLIGFFLERKPCTICSLVFLVAVFLICNSGVGNCLFWGNCEGHTCDNG